MSRRAESSIELVIVLGLGGVAAWTLYKNRAVAVTPTGQVIGEPSVKLPTSGPIGIRNNNPGNLRPSVPPFNGTAGQNKGYAVFSSPVYGIRAIYKLLKNYKTLYGLDTIAKIAARWAPADDGNNVAAYAANVALMSGIGQNTAINTSDFATMTKLAKGIIGAENGAAYTSHYGNDVFSKAWSLV